MAAGKEDIAPELLKKVQEDYRKRCENDKELARIEALAENGKANGKDTDAYAVRAGELLAAALHDNVSGDVLPDGKMYFNIANRVLPPVLRDNYELVAGMSARIQQVLNDNAGLHMKALRPDLNEDRVKGLVNLAASADQYEDKRKELEADVVNFSQRISADSFHKNAEFQYTSGFTPKIRREAESGCCEWCQALEGTYDYADVRDTGNDVWRRHRGCKCVVEYDPGTGRRQNAHAKTWSQADDHRKKIEDAERMMDEREREQRINSNEQEKKSRINDYSVDRNVVDTKAYRDKFTNITPDSAVNEKLYAKALDMLDHRDGTDYEDMHLISILDGLVKGTQTKVEYYEGVSEELRHQHVWYNKSLFDAIKNNPANSLISIHNHPQSLPPSGGDFKSQFDNGYSGGVIVCHNGDIYYYEVGKKNFSDIVYDMTVDKYYKRGYSLIEAYEKTLNQFVDDYGIKWSKL